MNIIEDFLARLARVVRQRSTANAERAARLAEFELLHVANIADCYALLPDVEARRQAETISTAVQSFCFRNTSVSVATEQLRSVFESKGPDEHHTMLRLLSRHAGLSIGCLSRCRNGSGGSIWSDADAWAEQLACIHSFFIATGEPACAETCTREFVALDAAVFNPEYIVSLYELGWELAGSDSQDVVARFFLAERAFYLHAIRLALG